MFVALGGYGRSPKSGVELEQPLEKVGLEQRSTFWISGGARKGAIAGPLYPPKVLADDQLLFWKTKHARNLRCILDFIGRCSPIPTVWSFKHLHRPFIWRW